MAEQTLAERLAGMHAGEEEVRNESECTLYSIFPGLSGFFGQTTRRFQFTRNTLTTNRNDADYILANYARFVREGGAPKEQ